MDILQESERLLAKMSRAEKAQLLQWVVRDLGDAFPGIDSTPDVLGGEPRIVRTRIPVWLLVRAAVGHDRSGTIERLPHLAGRGPGQCLGLLPRL